MLDGWLLVIRNSLGIVPLLVLVTGAELTPKSGDPCFENEVQDIPGCWMRRAKINCPSVGFVRARLCEKIF